MFSRNNNLRRSSQSPKLRNLVLVQATAEGRQDGESGIAQTRRKRNSGITGTVGCGLHESSVGDLVNEGDIQGRRGIDLDEERRRVVLKRELGARGYRGQMWRWCRAHEDEFGENRDGQLDGAFDDEELRQVIGEDGCQRRVEGGWER